VCVWERERERDGFQKQPSTHLGWENSGDKGEHEILMRNIRTMCFVSWLVFLRFSLCLYVCGVSFIVKETVKVCNGVGSLKVRSCDRNVTFTFWPFHYLHQTINLGSNSSTPCSWQLCTAGWGALFVRNRWLADTHTHTHTHTHSWYFLYIES
jgi:hypothetical protein